MAYRCSQAIIGGAREPIRCKVSGTVCAHQKYCLMEGKIVLTDQSLWCPARGGRLMPDELEKDPETVPEAQAEETEGDPSTPLRSAQDDTGEPAKKTTRKKTASRKKE